MSNLEQRHPAPVPGVSHTRYEFSVYDDEGCTEPVGGSAPTYEQVLSEGQHYLAQYLQDGPHTLELRRVEVLNWDAAPPAEGEGHYTEPAQPGQCPLLPAVRAGELILAYRRSADKAPHPLGLAAALRWLADQVRPTKQNYYEASQGLEHSCLNGMAYAANELVAIAAELEGQ